MKFLTLALAAMLAASAIAPAVAATDLTVPVASTAPTVDPNADIASFNPAALVQLSWNSTKSSAADESTSAMITTDGKYLYVRFDATQKERIVSAAGKTDGDLVWVDLWPNGSSGASYRFASSPDGSAVATSSTGTAPAVQASGSTFPGGYTVTMKIPLASMGATAGSGLWNVQFARTIHDSGQQLVWSHAGSGSPDDVATAGTMTLSSVAADAGH